MDPFRKRVHTFFWNLFEKRFQTSKNFPKKGFRYPHQELLSLQFLFLCRDRKVFASTGVRYNLHFAGALGTLFLSGKAEAVLHFCL